MLGERSGTESQEHMPETNPESAPVPMVSADDILLDQFKALDRLQTQGSLMVKVVEALDKRVSSFRVPGQRLEDGTLECILGSSKTPVRVAPDGDIAVGAAQIERQKKRA